MTVGRPTATLPISQEQQGNDGRTTLDPSVYRVDAMHKYSGITSFLHAKHSVLIRSFLSANKADFVASHVLGHVNALLISPY